MKQKTRSKNSREKIISIASDCFARIGYNQTDVEEICRKADLTKGAFYYHFSSKQDLFLKIMDQWINRLVDQTSFSTMDTDDILEIMKKIPEQFSPLFEEAGNQLPVFMEIYVKSFSDPPLKKIVLTIYGKFIQFFSEMLKMGIANKSIRKMDPKEGAEILFSMTVGILMHGLLRPDSTDWEEHTRKVVDLLLAPQ